MYADDVARAMAEALRPKYLASSLPFDLRRRDGQVIVPARTAMSDAHLALIANSIREGSFGSFAEAGVGER